MHAPDQDRQGCHDVLHAIRLAEEVLPGEAAPEGELDPRWQAIIKVADFAQEHPEEVWEFAARWGQHPDDDLRMAIATCVLEHLLANHFDLLIDRVEELSKSSRLFADTFSSCWKFGEAEITENAARLGALKASLADSWR